MFEKILLPLDGSQLAEVVIPYMELLAGRLGSEVILLHVCPSDWWGTPRNKRSYQYEQSH